MNSIVEEILCSRINDMKSKMLYMPCDAECIGETGNFLQLRVTIIHNKKKQGPKNKNALCKCKHLYTN